MQPIDKGCLNIHGTLVTANRSTTNNVMFFVVWDFFKNYPRKNINPQSKFLGKKRKNILRHEMETKLFKTVQA